MKNSSEPVLQSAKNPGRKTCLPLSNKFLHHTDIVGLFPDNHGPTLPQDWERALHLYLVRESLIGSFT
jgi:hypothetical protein